MPPIRVMPEILSNKIAAGEVVERPASVVKELVENAIDAGSTRIQVDIEHGGRRRIRVSDNGSGMPKDDALLSIERYATSKIHHDKDLYAIATLGFRGEALPSIASVSRFTLVTRDGDSQIGTQLVVHGGRLQNVVSAGAPVGTLIDVEELFFNTPARRKFLKSVQTEMGHIADTLAEIALGWPAIRFRLTHDERIVKDWAAGESRFRVADVLGKELDRHLLPVEGASNRVTLSGWVASSSQFRATSRSIHIFVNGRSVRDRLIRHALLQGYTGRQVKGQFPIAVLFITVPADEVDVNVHPTKHEIRFAHSQEIHRIVSQTVGRVLSTAERPSWNTPTLQARWEPKAAEDFPDYSTRSHLSPPAPATFNTFPSQFDPSDPGAIPAGEPRGSTLALDSPPKNLCSTPTQSTLWEKNPLGEFQILGQYLGTYILCQSTEKELVLIDQHAAHERIAFEQLKKHRITRPPLSQRRIMPETFELSFQEAETLSKMLPGLFETGLEIEPFGGNTFIVKAVPNLLSNRAVLPLIRELVEKGTELGIKGNLDAATDDILATMACHSVVRAHQELSRDQMRALISELMSCEDPAHCPHGRPTWIRFSVREVEKRFGRIV
jgi:DNA mismatch repair protein MutL